MGRIRSESQQNETTASHFSHPHPLNLISHQTIPNSSPNYSCSACKLKLSGIIYSCTICNFFLHKNCYQMPRKITHPFHKDHAFDLLPKPAYTGGAFNCDACGETGDGFSYHCKPCGIDLHILCAAAPLTLATACHHHKLELVFGSPYDTKNFECDVCSGHGLDHWLYRCSACGFDAHLKCARAAPPPPPQPPTTHSGVALGVPGVSVQNELVIQAILQMMQNNNAMVQAMLAGGGGIGGGVGGDRRLQQIMQLVSVLNRSGLGGGGIPGLDILGGGGLDSLLGGGSLDFLGGGGLDFLGGGLDILGGLGGLFL